MLNKPTPHLDDIISKINAASDLSSSADIIAERKQEIFKLLKNEIVEGVDDEQKLQQLQEKLNEKKELFEKDLGL